MDQRIEEKIDKLDARLDSIDITLAKQNVTLEEHVRRTSLLESELKPVERHVAMVNGGLKVIAGLMIIIEAFKLLGIIHG